MTKRRHPPVTVTVITQCESPGCGKPATLRLETKGRCWYLCVSHGWRDDEDPEVIVTVHPIPLELRS